MTRFRKMHGLGNDFVVFDARKSPLALVPATARAIASRRFGVGCDQVVAIAPGHGEFAAVMKIWNADGGEVESCGNAARCVARLLMDETGVSPVKIDTAGGALTCTDAGGGGVSVDMGAPKFAWNEIPLARAQETGEFVMDVDGAEYTASALSMGNPHCVLFVEDTEAAPVATLGPRIERNALFPKRTNVEFVSVLDRTRLRMRVWERGAGITLACGTGACASAVAAHRCGFAGRKVEVTVDGGTLAIEWRMSDDHVLMTGPVALVFTGEINLGAFA